MGKILACVVFFLLIGSLMIASADVVFQDTFDGGSLSNWTLYGAPTIVSTPVVGNSKYSVQFHEYSSPQAFGGYKVSYIQMPFPQLKAEQLEFYFRTDSAPNNVSFLEVQNGNLNFLGKDTTLLQLITIQSTNNDSDWVLVYPINPNPGATSSGSFKTVSSNLQADVWYKIDLAIDSTSGSIQLSIDDSLVFSESNVQFNWNPTNLLLGNIASDNNNDANIYIDNVSITTAAVPTVTPTANPTITTPSATANQSPTPGPSLAKNVPEFTSVTFIVVLLLSLALVATIIRTGHKRFNWHTSDKE